MSLKKSTFIIIAVIVIVTGFQLSSTGGDSMQIDFGETGIMFSGIDDFRHEVAYSDIVSMELNESADYPRLGGHEFGAFRIGQISSETSDEKYVLFVTTQATNVIELTLADGSRMIFNYNTTSSTEALYEMLLAELG